MGKKRMTIEEKMDKAEDDLKRILSKLQEKADKKSKLNPEKKKKNSHVHILINTEEKNKLMKIAEEEGLDFSEWCRKQLRDNEQLNRIEEKIDKLLKNQSLI